MKKTNESMKQYDLLGILSKINEKGLFDDFSDEHFLIKALNGKLDYFNKHEHLIRNSLYYSDEWGNAVTFIMNFSAKLNFFYNHFKEEEMDIFIKDQLSAGKHNYREEQFFQAIAEVNVLNFLMSYGPAQLKKTIYQPKLGEHGSNPEARLVYENGIKIDVEVKTPGFNRKINGDEKGVLIPTFLLNDNEKINFKKQCDKRGFKFIFPRVSKLKDYINSAGKKFETPEDSNHINLLFINWTYTDVESRGYLEPYSLLYNNLNGLLKNKDAALSVGISEEALKKISAIIVYQDTFDSLIFGNLIDIWNGYNFRVLPNMIMDKDIYDVDKIRMSTRMNPPRNNDDMMPYVFSVKEEAFNDAIEVTQFINKIIKAKIKGEDNFTYFTEEYYENKINELKKEQQLYDKWREQGLIL